MMKKLYFLFLCIILLIGTRTVNASPSFFFRKYMAANGLSHNTVLCGLQDSYGFIWLGTSNGLNCYDGNNNVVYRNMLNESFSFENNFVISLFEENRNIWIGANYGLYVYNRASNKFSRFAKTTRYGVVISSEVRRVIKARNNMIWISTLGQGLFIYNPKDGYLYQNSIHASYTCDICQGSDGVLYVSSMQGELLRFSEDGKYLGSYSIPNYANIKEMNCLKNVNGEIWMGAGGSLYKLNKSTNKLEKYDSNTYFGSIHCLLRYSSQEILVGTDKGLYLFNVITRLYQRKDNPLDYRSLSDQAVNAMMWDKEGSLWVMTNLGGVNYMSKQSTLFNFYSLQSNDGRGNVVSKKIVGSFCETKGGNVWVGTQNGLYYYNKSTKQIFPYRGGILSGDVRSIMQDGSKLWLGTYDNGIRVINLKNGNVKAYTYSKKIPYTICSNSVYCIYKIRKGDIYVGTNWGLCRYDSIRDRFMLISTMSSMTSITDMLEDASGNLWVATSNCGVMFLDTHTGKWRHYAYEKNNSHSITSNSVIKLFRDSNNTIWFGTNGGGLCSFDPRIDGFINFDPNNTILPNSVIYAMEQDKEGCFWISTNAGLTKINPTNKADIHQYTVGDDLWGGSFSQHSSIFTSQGEMLFGSINGFYSFFPQKLTEKGSFVPIYITDISFPYLAEGDKEKERLHLNKPLYMEREIVLPYKDNSFSIHFVALRYGNPSKARYSYMLKGVNEQWAQETESNVASYVSLSPGKYEFLLRENNSGGKEASLWIIVMPPWYRSNLAYFVYILLILLVGYYVFKGSQTIIRKKIHRQMEEHQLQQEQEAYKSKIKFFVNLMHEIRTPLSLISLPLERMQEEKQNAINEKYIAVIHKNLDYLLGVTNQLLDFEKVENGALALNLEEYDIKSILNGIYNQFVGYANLKGIELKLILCDQDVISLVDKDKIGNILVNLMGNAIKYARQKIEMELICTLSNYEIWVCDDGVCIPDSEKERIFETFYQLHGDKIAATMGTGIGLSYAKALAEAHHGGLRIEDNQGGGSKFILSLPIEKGKVQNVQSIAPEVTTEGSTQSKGIVLQKGFKSVVLLVEDNVELLEMTADSLQQWYCVLNARNGQEALEVLANEEVNVIVSDVMMPEMDGLELCNKVKSDINYSHIPVILLTAKTTLESKVEGMENGADAYIEKPFLVQQVRLQIDNLLKLRQAFHQLMISFQDSGDNGSIMTDYGLTQKDCKFTADLQALLTDRLADENFSLDTLAEELNMSRSSFYRKIKALSGMSPNDYMKSVRMNKAAELIGQGERISEVAAQVGFSSSSYFAKCFKAQFGVLPKEFVLKKDVHNDSIKA